MRVHVLGLGPIGQLIAFHLRKDLAPKENVVLMFKDAQLAHRMANRPIYVELAGSSSSISGFKTESTSALNAGDRPDYPFANKTFGTANNALATSVLSRRENIASVDRTANAEVVTSHEAGVSAHGALDSAKIESLFITCKAHSTLQAVQQVYHRLSPNCTIVLMHNGNLAVHKQLMRDVFKSSTIRPHFVLASITHNAWLRNPPSHVVHTGIGQTLFGIVPSGKGRDDFGFSTRYLGRLTLDDIVNSDDDPSRQERYCSLRNTIAILQSLSELQPRWCAFTELLLILRRMLVVNGVINPLTTILCCKNGEIEANPEAQRIAKRICYEAARVFTREIVATSTSPRKSMPVPRGLQADALFDECMHVARSTADNTSSMLADVLRGKRVTEIDYLNGYLVDLGARYGFRLPTNATMVDLVKLRTELPLDLMV